LSEIKNNIYLYHQNGSFFDRESKIELK
jgi:hypothetical protein